MRQLMVRLMASARPSGWRLRLQWRREYPQRPVRIIIPLGPGSGGDVFTRLIAEELQKAIRPALRGGEPSRRRAQHRHARLRGGRSPTATRSVCCPASPWSTTSFCCKSLPVQSGDRLPAGREPVRQLQRARGEFRARRQDHSGACCACEIQARHAELRHVLVHAGLFHGPAEQEERHRHRARAVSQRQRHDLRTPWSSGSTPVVFLGLSNMVGQIKSGQVTGLALNAYNRSPLFPGIPTLKEAVGEDYPPPWFGMFAPAGTPRADPRQGPCRADADHGRAGIPSEELRAARRRSHPADAGRVRKIHCRQSRLRGACRQEGRNPAAIAVIKKGE